MTGEASSVQSNYSSYLSYAARSDIGMRREENQDSMKIIEGEGLHAFLVADGMGGVRGGAIASNLALETIRQIIARQGEVSREALVSAIEYANTQIFERGVADPSLAGMGTTLVGVVFIGSGLFIINVGDSRAYRVRAKTIEQLTEDHTLVMELLRSGTISPEQVHNHPVSHMLTRSLGPSETVEVDCILCTDGPLCEDKYLLCSDGLYNLVKEQEILAILDQNSLDEAVQTLINLANERGGSDNITVVAVEVGKEFPEVSLKRREQLAHSFAELEEEERDDEKSEVNGDAHLNARGYVSSDGERPGRNVYWDSLPEEEELPLAEDQESEETERSDSAQTGHESHPQNEPEQGEQPSQEEQFDGTEVRERISLESLREAHVGSLTDEQEELGEQIASKLSSASFDRDELTGAMDQPVEIASPALWTRSLFVMPYLLAASLGGVAVAVLLYSPEGHQHNLAQVVEQSLQDTRIEQSVRDPAERNVVVGSAQDSTPLQSAPDHARSSNELDSVPHTTGIEARQSLLLARIEDIEHKLSAFEGPLSGQLGERLEQADRRRAELERQLEEVRSELDVATRKLAVWYGRRKRLESTPAIDMAGEVAVSSPEVEQKKEQFESITWEYLKQSEHLRYNPNDTSQAQKVAELLRQRKQQMEDVATEVKAAISRSIGAADQHIAELTFDRDKIQAEIQGIQSDVQLVKIISGNDVALKNEKRGELIRERDLARAELAELQTPTESSQEIVDSSTSLLVPAPEHQPEQESSQKE